ncbi:F0F1 ATP synthase subunit A [Rhodoplanes sp. TEM]|uniref:ATP synthase subunit a n=1 Tax=Rhodoplanes tepidamans TaxID=200616 RepID=A0ABT5J9R7_RHOTP|nr:MULTISPECIES: F0F1 ATP synthase subunit A [Rhodoplanes]MDC7786388.1 F0F1 ATP synthase subunit A [Rhodoplanes tepidamans]MDC7985460.1 F0F1 ATP synthase subunit A [Rhodoplanes sp. TEM]MDQ0354132.1 F-type H+-transporting ATPase subunit a [Rhodoplanes tepidamans]
MADPIHQFEIVNLAPLVKIGATEIQLTNSAVFMMVAVGITAFLMIGATAGRQLVPGRLQSMAEVTYEFVADMIRSTAGEEGLRFFPLVFSLFTFILFANIVGIVPYTFTVTSHIVVTATLALLVFFTVIGYGLYSHGLGFFRLFVPHGIPGYILPFVVLIEIVSFLSRPISHSVRLFANMLAGHITLKVFAGFVAGLGGALGLVGWVGGVLPLAMVTALTALELLVAFLQAYVFTLLTCIYLSDALHPGH